MSGNSTVGLSMSLERSVSFQNDIVAGEFVITAPPVGPDASCGQVYSLMVDNPGLPGIAVVDNRNTAIGMIDRQHLLTALGHHYGRALYDRKPVRHLMERSPLKVDVSTRIDDIVKRIASDQPRALSTGFIIEEHGQYRGIGLPLQLIAKIAEQATARVSELKVLQEKAESASRAKMTFLATVSHEIRTPLNGVVGNLELLGLSDLSDEQLELVNASLSSSETLLEIIGDILDFSRIEAGPSEPEHSEIRLGAFVREIVGQYAGTATRKGLGLFTTLAPDVPLRVRTDALRLKQILSNFVNNALKFTDQGVVQISVWNEQYAHGPRSGEETTLRFEVMDTGQGFPPEAASKLFDAFTQLNRDVVSGPAGSGLGLAISHRLAESLGGTVGASSCLGYGATFWLNLPVELVESAKPLGPAPLAARRVLAMGNIAASIAAGIEKHGGIARIAADLESGLALANNARDRGKAFDVLIVAENNLETGALDIDLAKWFGHRPMVLVAGTADPVTRYRALASGYSAHFQAPVEIEGLVQSLCDIIDSAEGNPAARNIPATGQSRIKKRDWSTSLASLSRDLPVLVVDDTPMNRIVSEKQVRKLGFGCETVNDGVEALRAATSGRYAFILCDLAMPRMDGTTFARHLREWEAGTTRRTPIIAVTGHALASDIRACEEAGIDGYLSKPVTLDRLVEAIGRHVDQTSAAQRYDATTDPEDEIQPLEWAGPNSQGQPVELADLAERLGEDDPAKLDRVLHIFVESFSTYMKALNEALAKGDRAGIRVAAHAAKGSALNAGAPGLAEVMARIESLSARAPLPRLREAFEGSRGEFSLVRRFVKARSVAVEELQS